MTTPDSVRAKGPFTHGFHRLHRLGATAVFALLVWAPASAAFTLSGTLTSGGKPLVGAQVSLLDLDRSQLTGEDGAFRFLNVPAGSYHVFAGLIGYASVTDTVEIRDADVTLPIELKARAIPMEEIVVSASPYARPADEQYQSAESRSQVPLLNSPGASFADKLSDLPGVAVRANGSAPNRPVLRGLSDNRVLVLENGLRMGDIATYDPAHATPVEAIGISRVDVVRGPATIIYGPSTIGGLVNVLTDVVPTVSTRRVTGTATVEGSTGSDQYAGYFNTVLSQGAHAFSASAGGLHSNDIRIPEGSYVDPGSGVPFALDRMPQTFDHSWEGGVGYAYESTAGSIGIGGKHYEMNYGIPGVPPNADWATVPPSTSRIAQKRNLVELHGLRPVSGGFAKQWRLDASYNDYGHSEFPTAQDSTGVSDPQANHFHKRTFNGALQLRHRPAGRLEGTLGLWTDIEDLTIEGDQPLGPNSRTYGYAGYAYEEFLLSRNTRLQAGARYDYNRIQTRPFPASTDSVFQASNESRLTNAFTGSLGAVHQFSPALTGSISLARSFRAPTVQELFANGLDAASGSYSIGNASLGPETGLGVDASLKGNFARAAFEVSPYANFVSDYIYPFLTGDTIQAFPVRQFAATDARLVGFEARVDVEPAPHLALLASTDYVNAQDTKADAPLPFTPPWRGVVRATYRDESRTGMIEVRLAADQNRLGPEETPTKGYAVLNLGAGLRFIQRGLVQEIGLHVDNVFDVVYRDHLSVAKDFLPQPGRALRLDYITNF
jgi:iron complex outermembrane receptor protein